MENIACDIKLGVFEHTFYICRRTIDRCLSNVVSLTQSLLELVWVGGYFAHIELTEKNVGQFPELFKIKMLLLI